MQSYSSHLRGQMAYDVIISCGDDTRSGFSGHLARSLNHRGFRACIDLHLEPLETKRCRIFILVFSDGYASSWPCLDQLVDIIDEIDKLNDPRWILPVFYYVKPSHVRHQKGSYGKALAVHKNQFPISQNQTQRFHNWTKALRKAADFLGCHLDRAKPKYEYHWIDEILQEVSQHMACSVGLNRQVELAMSCLFPESQDGDDGVHMAGICGDPGIGKTRIASAVYHSNAGSGFDYSSFFDKGIRLDLSKHELENLDEWMSTMKCMLNKKKVFLIFVNIDNTEHVRVIVELSTCFGSGSKVIITAREKFLLNNNGIERIYEVERLNKEEAFQLLSLKAFNSMNFEPRYLNILERAATCAFGNPFATELIGSHLCGNSIEECEDVLGLYESIPNNEIQNILQVSFDALGKNCQRVLIHIGNHLKGQELTQVEDRLYGLLVGCPKKHIRVLLGKSLLKIDELGRVTLHGLTLDMVAHNNRSLLQK